FALKHKQSLPCCYHASASVRMHFNTKIVDVVVIIVLHVLSPLSLSEIEHRRTARNYLTEENLDRYPPRRLSFRLLPAGHSDHAADVTTCLLSGAEAVASAVG